MVKRKERGRRKYITEQKKDKESRNFFE